jgi:hypothetical protein
MGVTELIKEKPNSPHSSLVLLLPTAAKVKRFHYVKKLVVFYDVTIKWCTKLIKSGAKIFQFTDIMRLFILLQP